MKGTHSGIFLWSSLIVTSSPDISFISDQVICEKIFCTWFSPTLLGDKAGNPLQVELQKAVQDCAETEGGDDAERSRTIRLRLQNLLRKLIQENLDNKKQAHSRNYVHTSLNF